MIAVLLATVLVTSDPRVAVVELSLADRHGEALAAVESAIGGRPAEARALGFDYLRAHLLEEIGRLSEADRAFASAIGTTPRLAAYARFRLAANQSRRGHPEVAAGLLATLLAGETPAPLVPLAVDLLVDALERGGDCRLLSALERWRLPDAERRRLLLNRADCELGSGRREAAESLLVSLLAGNNEDDPARAAAERLDSMLSGGPPSDRALVLSLGLTFHHHRQFERSTGYLALWLGRPLEPTGDFDTHLDTLYALARGHFWRGEYLVAASAFGQLASLATEPERRARSLYQQARCYELFGEWELAADSYRRVVAADPQGRWAGAALFSNLRLAWRSGNEEEALASFEQMGARREWRGLRSRAALFLAASDLVRGRADRAGPWLDAAASHPAVPAPEAAYWRGRSAELIGSSAKAAAAYAEALRSGPYHPLASSAAARLASPPLAAAAEALAGRLADSRSPTDLALAWRLVGNDHPEGARARAALERRLAASSKAREFLGLEGPPPAQWPLWTASLTRPEELLLALGIWNEGAPAISKHFPVARPDLGFVGSQLLSRGGAARRSLRQAEILNQRIPAELPAALLESAFRTLLYPLPYRGAIETEAGRHGVDPFLLAALIREESRFDPRALSAASARGLTQFVLPTAQELSGRLGIEGLTAGDLYKPAVSIALGAAYLGELEGLFGAGSPAAVAAYNAGPEQARLWQAYCFSREPEELLAKVGFDETRHYLERVLTSRNHYREIYGASSTAGQPPAAGGTVPTTSPGGASGGSSK